MGWCLSLQELYSRQKKNLGNNLHRKDKKSLGETYSKGRSDFRSIIYPYNHPFQQDEVEVNSLLNFHPVLLKEKKLTKVCSYLQVNI